MATFHESLEHSQTEFFTVESLDYFIKIFITEVSIILARVTTNETDNNLCIWLLWTLSMAGGVPSFPCTLITFSSSSSVSRSLFYDFVSVRLIVMVCDMYGCIEFWLRFFVRNHRMQLKMCHWWPLYLTHTVSRACQWQIHLKYSYLRFILNLFWNYVKFLSHDCNHPKW